MRSISIRDRRVIAALLVVLIAAGAAVWFLRDRDGDEEIRVGSQVLEQFEGLKRVVLEIEAISPTQGEGTLSGEFVLDVGEQIASGELEMGATTNVAGIFGDYEVIPTAWDGYEGLFDLTLPEGEWLALDLEGASPAGGADIAWLREAVLCNPNLALVLIESAQDPSQGSFQVPLTKESTAVPSEVSSVLRDDWGAKGVTIVIGGTEANLEFTTEFRYPVVPTSQDEVKLTCSYTLTPGDDDPRLPDDAEVVTYEDLS